MVIAVWPDAKSTELAGIVAGAAVDPVLGVLPGARDGVASRHRDQRRAINAAATDAGDVATQRPTRRRKDSGRSRRAGPW